MKGFFGIKHIVLPYNRNDCLNLAQLALPLAFQI